MGRNSQTEKKFFFSMLYSKTLLTLGVCRLEAFKSVTKVTVSFSMLLVSGLFVYISNTTIGVRGKTHNLSLASVDATAPPLE